MPAGDVPRSGPAECCGNERSWQCAVTEARAVYEHGQEKDG
ncbi:hypothetical protein [Streptomyces sp. NPDC001480]